MRDEARLVGLLYRTDWTRLRLSARLSDGSTVVIAPGRRYRFEAAGYATGCDGGRPTICRTADVLLPRTGGRTPGAAFHNRGCRCHRQHDGAGLPEGPGKVVGCGGLPQVFEHAGEIADDRHAGLPVGGFDFGSQGAIPEATEGSLLATARQVASSTSFGLGAARSLNAAGSGRAVTPGSPPSRSGRGRG